MLYAFQLGREYKLSIAEIYAVFPESLIVYADTHMLIMEARGEKIICKNILDNMGGVIKVMELEEIKHENPVEKIVAYASGYEGKFRYGLSIFGTSCNLKGIVMDIKKELKIRNISNRFVNKNFENLTSAQIIGENLIERRSDFTYIVTQEKKQYIGKSIWVQDIEAYGKRDYGKTRDMEVGMLPPKLAQMMLNIGKRAIKEKENKNLRVYDPFCGLGTVLIEAIAQGAKRVYASDISQENIKKTQANIEYAKAYFDKSECRSQVQVLDAKDIQKSIFLGDIDVIVTEGYLGKIFQKYSITEKKLEEEKEILKNIYEAFFAGLQKKGYTGTLVISFPFWEMHGKYLYFTEIYTILKKYCHIQKLLPKLGDIRETRSGSLLYKREKQIVGREIFLLTIKTQNYESSNNNRGAKNWSK